MNKKSWLIVGLSLAMAASIGVGISACGGDKDPDTPPTPTEHTHTYDAWDYNDTQHWKYCDEHGTDKSNIDETTKANHEFKDGKCECGATEGGEIPDADLDTREFWATGAGAGDLQNSSWTELKPNFKLTKQPHKDEDGFTLYTIQFKIYAGGDSFKIRQDEKDENGALKWTDGTYFGIDELRNASGTFIDAGTKNIGVATGKDGIYKFTVHTKPSPAPWKDNFVTWELIESVTPPTTTEDMYIVGKLATYPKNDWPGFGKIEDCIHMTFDGDKTWSATITVKNGDQFKVYNKLNQQYYPDQGGNLTRPSDAPDGLFEVKWVSGAVRPTVTHIHNYVKWGYDDAEHWKACDFDSAEQEGTREEHDFGDGDTCECGFQKEGDPDWKINDDGTLQEYTGGIETIKIPANLKVFPKLDQIFGKNSSGLVDQNNLAKLQSLTIDPKNEYFKIENNAVLSIDGTTLYLYLPYSTETEVTFENVTTVGDNAFYGNSTVTTVNLPEAVTLGSYAFYYSSSLANISLPKVETISAACFGKVVLTSIELESVKTIKINAFYDCKQLKTIVFGEQLSDIGDGKIFSGDTIPTSVTVKATTPPKASASWGIGLYSSDPTKVYVPAESVDAYKAAEGWSKIEKLIEAIPAEAVSAQEVALPASKKED